MNWRDLQVVVAERSGLPITSVRKILQTAMEVSVEALTRGEEVPLRGVGVLSARWKPPRVVRSVANRRKLRIDGRFVPRFQPSRSLRQALVERTEQTWRDPAHQEAWRVAETLVGDLDLYHPDKAPRLAGDEEHEDVHKVCARSFGRLWNQVETRFAGQVPENIRVHGDYLAQAALARWTQTLQFKLA